MNARLAQACAGDQPAETAADNDDLGEVVERRALDALGDIGVVDVVGELAGDLDVLVVAIGTQALVSFGAIARAQGIRVESKIFSLLCHLRSPSVRFV